MLDATLASPRGNRHLLGVVGFQSRFKVTSYSPAFKCSTSKKMVSTGISSSTGMGGTASSYQKLLREGRQNDLDGVMVNVEVQ